jgi:hypothetical protein
MMKMGGPNDSWVFKWHFFQLYRFSYITEWKEECARATEKDMEGNCPIQFEGAIRVFIWRF